MASRGSVPALVTYWLLGIWTLTVAMAFTLVIRETVIQATTLGLLSGIIGTETTLLVAAVSFWVGSTVGAKALGDKLADQGARAQATLAGMASTGTGAGQMPGTTTTTTTTTDPMAPIPVEVTNQPGNPVPVAQDEDQFKIKP